MTDHSWAKPARRRENEQEYERAAALISEVCKVNGVSVGLLRSNEQGRKMRRARRQFCERARELDISIPVIGDILHRRSETIYYHLDKRIRDRKSHTRKRLDRRKNTESLALVLITGPIL